MRVKGWLLDVQLTGNKATLWVKDVDKGRIKLLDDYHPNFFVETRCINDDCLKNIIEEHNNIEKVTFEQRTLSIKDCCKKKVLRVYVDKSENYPRVLAQIEAMPYIEEVYDADIENELKYLSDKNLIPFQRVSIKADRNRNVHTIKPIKTEFNIEPPPLQTLRFCMNLSNNEGLITTFDPTLKIEYVFNGSLKTVLRDFLDYFADFDPDVIVCRDNDLESIIRLSKHLRLRRFGCIQWNKKVLWGGRSHVSISTYGRLGLEGLVERVQYTRVPARLSAEWAAGRAIESRQCYEARKSGVLIPQMGGFQSILTLKELLLKDHGGLIFTPDVGLHENVAVLDFESMFPSLIVHRNISYETVNRDSANKGFMIDFTQKTLQRRLHLKHLMQKFKEGSKERIWCERRQLALKEILFCTYGYSGCWANRFGNFETFMEINRAARKSLVKSMSIAREHDLRIIYGNNDSLFVKHQKATVEDYEKLALEISQRVGLPMAVENFFKFLVLLPQKSNSEIGAVNRYFGRTIEDKYVCRGIELRRRDTPSFISRVQMNAIKALLGRNSIVEIYDNGVKEAIQVVKDACECLRNGTVPLEELKIATILRRNPREYKARLPHVAAAEALKMRGFNVEAGNLIDYVYVNAYHRNRFRRVRSADYEGRIDIKKYIQLVKEAGRSILAPFNVNLDFPEKDQTLFDDYSFGANENHDNKVH